MSSWARGVEEVEEANEDGLLEGELAQLQLRYRVMQNSFHAYKEETKRKIAKQRMLVKRLELDNIELHTDLGKLETLQNKAKDERNVGRLRDLSKLEKDYHSLINEEKARMKSIDSQTADIEKKIAEQRKTMGGTHNSTANYNKNQKQIAVLENRLDKAVTLFNKQLARNDKLRSDIDHLRQERAVFDNLYKKLAQELEKTKRETAVVIRDSTEAFEQRDDARNKMMALIERSEKDKEQHEIEMRDLQRMIQHDNRIREFMGIKADDRAALKAEETAKKQKMDADKLASADQVTINQYEEALNKLKETTKENNIKAIVETFEKNEEENFALFNYVNELNNEMESLTDQVAAVRADIAQFQAEDQTVDQIHESMVHQLEEHIDDVQMATERAEMNLRRVNKLLDELLSSIFSLFTHIGCDQTPILQMLDSGSGIRSKNVMVYMGQIEQRTIELLTTLAYKQKKVAALDGEMPKKPVDLQAAPLPLGVTQFTIPAPSASLYELPATTDAVHEEEGEYLPLTQEELRQQVIRSIQNRGAPCPQQITAPTSLAKDKKKKK